MVDNKKVELRLLSLPVCFFLLLFFSSFIQPLSFFLSLFPFLCFSVQEAIITGLLPETTYSVTVAAYTTKGDGARSKAKVVTTTGAGESTV